MLLRMHELSPGGPNDCDQNQQEWPEVNKWLDESLKLPATSRTLPYSSKEREEHAIVCRFCPQQLELDPNTPQTGVSENCLMLRRFFCQGWINVFCVALLFRSGTTPAYRVSFSKRMNSRATWAMLRTESRVKRRDRTKWYKMNNLDQLRRVMESIEKCRKVMAGVLAWHGDTRLYHSHFTHHSTVLPHSAGDPQSSAWLQAIGSQAKASRRRWSSEVGCRWTSTWLWWAALSPQWSHIHHHSQPLHRAWRWSSMVMAAVCAAKSYALTSLEYNKWIVLKYHWVPLK